MKEAAEFAESTQILMNVSEFTDVSQATDTLISSVQAFGYTAETSMDVVDLLNTIGNNYAISTADLAQSLTKSSASLVAAGGDLAEAAALTATANAIIQDAESVGTALKTTSLRLRGTSVETLDEEGLDSYGAIDSTSKLRGKVKALSGVDILTETGEYKSTYAILSQIADVWEDINNMDQAALLELLAGKRNASVLAAILQAPEQLKAAYEDAQNAEGSALKENEKYLDSIQGRIDQFNNAMQTMWSNALDSDVVKWFVEFGTTLINIIDDVGLLKIAFMGLGMYLTRGIDFTGMLSPAEESLEQMQKTLGELKAEMESAEIEDIKRRTDKTAKKKENATKRYTEYEEKVKLLETEEKLNQKAKERLDLEEQYKTARQEVNDLWAESANGDIDLSDEFDKASASVDDLKKKIDENGMSIDDATKRMKNLGDQSVKTGNKGKAAFQKIGNGIKAAGKALKEFLVQMAVMYAVTTALELVGDVISGIADFFDDQIETAEEAQEALDEVTNELSTVQSELKSLNSELDSTKDRIDELMEQGTLSFAEEEELQRLREVNAELERKIALNESLEESLQKAANAASINATDAYMDTSFGSDLSRTERQEKTAETGGKWGKYGGAATGAVIGSFFGPGIGTLIGAGIGAFIGEPIGEAVGSAVEGAAYDAEQTVADAMDNMVAQRAELKKNQDDALASKDTEAYKHATEALQMYDQQMAKHISQIQANYNAMDWATATEEQKKQMIEYADWLDKYSINMGVANAKVNAIDRIFGAEAIDGFDEARKRIDELKENLKEAQETGDELAIADALEELNNFKLDDILSDKEIKRLREMGIYLYEAEDRFKDVARTEAEFVDGGLEDVAKDINQIADGLGALKSAFEEVAEQGVLTAKTVMSLKDELNIASYTDNKAVTESWNEYLKVMMSGVASTEEMTEATEKMAQAMLEAALEQNALTTDTKWEYVVQLKNLGVSNAEEFVDNMLKKNMITDIEKNLEPGKDALKKWYEDTLGKLPGAIDFDLLSDEMLSKLAEQSGLTTEMSDEAKKNIAEQYGLEVDQIDEVIDKLKEKAKLEEDLATTKSKKQEYDQIYDEYRRLKEDLDVALSPEDVTKISEDYAVKIKAAMGKGVGEVAKVNKEFEAANPLNIDMAQVSVNDNMKLVYKGAEYDSLEDVYLAEYTTSASNLAKFIKQHPEYFNYDEWSFDDPFSLFRKIADGTIEFDTGIAVTLDADEKNSQEEIDKLNTLITNKVASTVELAVKLQDQHKLVDDIQSVYDTLANAQKEYDATGYVSVDTLQNLLLLEPKYLDMLVDEKGNLNLNKQAILEVARARITDMGLQQQEAILKESLALASEGTAQAIIQEIAVKEEAMKQGKNFIEQQMDEIQVILDKRVALGEISQTEADAFMDATLNQLEAVQVTTKLALDNLGNAISSDNSSTAEVESAFQRAMTYWQNRIGANQSLYEQLQNDIDLAEKKGQIVGASYYQAQMSVEQEHLQHLMDQRKEALMYLGQFEEGSDEWWEAANTLNDIENEIDSVTLNLQDLTDAIAQVHWTVFDEAHERLSNLTTQLSNIREILSSDEDSFFNDEGEWTEKGVAVLGTYIQEIELYKNYLGDVEKEMLAFQKEYKGSEAYYAEMGIDSEQEYYDKLTELTDKQHEYTKVINDSEQSVVDMYESQVEAIEEYTNTLVESYQDYIDSVKEALDAERD